MCLCLRSQNVPRRTIDCRKLSDWFRTATRRRIRSASALQKAGLEDLVATLEPNIARKTLANSRQAALVIWLPIQKFMR